MKKVLFYSVVFVSLSLAGCLTFPQNYTEPENNEVTVTYSLPQIKPVEATKQDQKRGKIRISVEPYSFTNDIIVVREEYKVTPTFIISNGRYPAKIKRIPGIAISPERVVLKVKVQNGLGHTLQLAGIVVSFKVDGQKIRVDQANYNKFLDGILIPSEEGEYDIIGPAISELKNDATIGLFLYDVPTATNDAGIPTKKENFAFYYKFSLESQNQVLPISIVDVYLNESQNILLQQRGGNSNWVIMPELHFEQ